MIANPPATFRLTDLESPNAFAGLRVLVMGLGRFGGGIGVTRFLADRGANVTVTDLGDPSTLAGSVLKLSDLAVRFRLGCHDEDDLDHTDLLVVSPAVDKRKSAFFQAAARRGIPWTSEMNLFLQRCPARLIGITGSAGKSTTCAMLGAILSRAAAGGAATLGRVWIGGNIGVSLLGELPAMTSRDTVLLELSSFQLEDAAHVRRSPSVAAITNIAANHLDRHGAFEDYVAVKLNIVRFQKPGDRVFLRRDDQSLVDSVRAITEQTGSVIDSVEARNRDWRLRVPGQHNLRNADMAATIAATLGVPDDDIAGALADFAGLPHRLQHVARVGGVDYYNDSKSTTPEATLTAVRSFDRPVTVLLGGADKHLPLDELAQTLAARAKAVICFGAAADRFYETLQHALGERAAAYLERCGSLAAAVEAAGRRSASGDIILLSPACASYDEFINYEARGERFVRLIAGRMAGT